MKNLIAGLLVSGALLSFSPFLALAADPIVGGADPNMFPQAWEPTAITRHT
jgi:hypothetical protein